MSPSRRVRAGGVTPGQAGLQPGSSVVALVTPGQGKCWPRGVGSPVCCGMFSSIVGLYAWEAGPGSCASWTLANVAPWDGEGATLAEGPWSGQKDVSERKQNLQTHVFMYFP